MCDCDCMRDGDLDCMSVCVCECSIDSLLPIERAANARVVGNHKKTSIHRRLSPARDSSPRTFDTLCATRSCPTGVLESKESRSDRSARAPARPRHDSADIRRDCPARSASVRSLPASIGRGSRACARTSCVWCRALRLALALALGTRTRHSHAALARGTRTRHAHPARAPGTRTRHAHAARALGTRTRHSHAAPARGTRTRHAHAARARGTRYPVRGTRHAARALGTRHPALNLGRRTVGPMESCRHPLVSSKRPETPQPRSRGPVRADPFRRADDSAHICSTCRLAAERGQDGCAEHPDPRSRKLRAAHPDLGGASSASGGTRPLPVPHPSIPGLDSSVGSQGSPRGRIDYGDRRRCRRRELETVRTPTRGRRTWVASTRAAADDNTTSRSPRDRAYLLSDAAVAASAARRP